MILSLVLYIYRYISPMSSSLCKLGMAHSYLNIQVNPHPQGILVFEMLNLQWYWPFYDIYIYISLRGNSLCKLGMVHSHLNIQVKSPTPQWILPMRHDKSYTMNILWHKRKSHYMFFFTLWHIFLALHFALCFFRPITILFVTIPFHYGQNVH